MDWVGTMFMTYLGSIGFSRGCYSWRLVASLMNPKCVQLKLGVL